MKNKELLEIVRRIKKKLAEQDIFIYDKCSDEVKLQLVETLYRMVLDEMEINKVVCDFNLEVWEEHFKNYVPIEPTFDPDKVYSEVPEHTKEFITETINERVEAGVIKKVIL